MADERKAHNAVIDYEFGDWVRCKGQIMYVQDSSDETEPGKLGLLKENAPLVYDKEWDMQFPKIEYYPVESVEKLPEVDVDEVVLRRFFRLETTPWKLCEQGLFPFSDRSGTFTLTEDDLRVFSSNLSKADAITMDDWETQFTGVPHTVHVTCPENDSEGLSLKLTWGVICDLFTWFDIDEDEPEVITDIIDAYFASKGKKLSEIDAPENLKAAIISYLEESATEGEITDDQRKAYVRFLNEMCEKGDTWALEHKAHAYYGGNRIVPCDWKIAEQTLLILEQHGDREAANSLGYIYYSNRLGEPDYDKAFFYFSKAAKAGIVEARYKLSDLYRKGHGTAKDTEKAFIMLKQVYIEQLASIQDGYFGCKYADVALRMGYCYEEGSGCQQDYHKAHEYFLRAKYAIDMRILKSKGFGDDVVKRNIEDALERIKEKDPDGHISITDLPGYPGSEYADITAEERHELLEGIDYLYQCDFHSDEFDPEGQEEHLDKAAEILEKYSFSDFYQASFEWMRNHCVTAEQYINFANLYFYYGGTDSYVDNPYPFLAYLYNGIDWDNDSVNAEQADNIFWSIAVDLLQHAEIYHGYADEYDPFKDPALTEERKRLAQVHGIVLNEDGYVTYPAKIFDCIKEEVISLNWRVSNIECGRDGSNYTFPFEDWPEYFVDGEVLYEMLQAHPEKQWWWGILSGFPKTISSEAIKKKPVIDVQMETPYLEKKIKHIDPDAVLEIIAFDSTETYVIADSEAVIKKLMKKYPKAESLEKYVD